MPNGKGSPSCGECKYCLLYRINTDDINSHGLCTRWNIKIPFSKDFFDNSEYVKSLLIPPEDFRTLNLICKDYICGKHHEILSFIPKRVKKRLEKGLLYAVHYNVTGDPNEYHKVVCILDENIKRNADKFEIKDYWLDGHSERFIGKRLIVTPLEHLDFFRDDPEHSDLKMERLDNKPFHIRLVEFWHHFGKHYGGIAKVEETGYSVDNFWVIFSISKAGIYNFKKRIGMFIVRLGPEEYKFWNGRWPRFATGIPRYYGWAKIKAEQ